MPKRSLIFLFALLFVVAGCSKPSAPAPSNVNLFDEQPVRTDIVFEFEDMNEYLFSMVLDPKPGALIDLSFAINIPDGLDSDWIGDTEHDAHYIIFDEKTKESLASIRINTTPSDLAAFYGTNDPDEILDNLVSKFFKAENAHNGLRNAIEDFKYEMMVDWSGTALGYSAYYMEFIDQDSQNHALRFYLSNDKLDESFYAFEFKADVPMDDQKQIDLYRAILFSLHEM